MATPQQQARKIVEQILGPQIRSTQEQYRNQGAGLNAAYQALAKMNAGVAPAIQGTYDTASSRQAVIAKGFADGFKQASEKSAFDANALLAQQGSPQQVVSQGEAGANALYGFGGAIPAGTLNQQGAAFSAAARFLPGQDRRLGIDAVKQANIGGRAAVKELEAKRPGLVQDALRSIQDAETKARAAKVNEDLAASLIGDRTAGAALARDTLEFKKQKASLDYNLAAGRLALSQDQYELALNRERRLSKPRKKGGFSASKKQEMQADAFQTAQTAFNGFYIDEGVKIEVGQKAPREVLSDLVGSGVPFSIAIRVIQRFARAKGASAEWRATLGWTKRRK